jgi:hypothetical protein
LVGHYVLPPAMLEEISKFEHADQQRFVDQFHNAASLLPRIHPCKGSIDRILHLYLVDKTALKRIARDIRDRILAELWEEAGQTASVSLAETF